MAVSGTAASFCATRERPHGQAFGGGISLNLALSELAR